MRTDEFMYTEDCRNIVMNSILHNMNNMNMNLKCSQEQNQVLLVFSKIPI